MDDFDNSNSTSAYKNIEPDDAERFLADAVGIQQRLNDNPNLGPEPFELVEQGGHEAYAVWHNNRFEVMLYGRDFMEDGDIVYSLEITATEDEGSATFMERAREILTAIRDPHRGARRRRNRRKTKKASKKRKSTKRRV
jgi:hypothetical protein